MNAITNALGSAALNQIGAGRVDAVVRATLSARALAWCRARAKGIKGEFSPEAFAEVAPYLGWSIEEGTGLVQFNGSNYDTLRVFQGNFGVRNPEAMQNYNDDSLWAVSREVEDKIQIVLAMEDKKGRLNVADPIPGVLYVSKFYQGQWGQGPLILWVKSPSVGVRSWTVRAPNGKTNVVLDKPRHKGDALKADSFWKWAYEQGLGKAAEALLPTEAEERAGKFREAVSKGLGICGICFQSHSIHKNGAVVQHGYKMGGSGWGTGHNGMFKLGGDCFGVGYLSFEKSPEVTRLYSGILLNGSKQETLTADTWESGNGGDVHILASQRHSYWPVTERVVWSGYEPDAKKGERVYVVKPGDPAYEKWTGKIVEGHRKQADFLASLSKWYAVAADNWPAYPFADPPEPPVQQ